MAEDGGIGPVERGIVDELAPTFSVRFVDAAGARLRVLEGGAGPPLLLLPGRGAASTSCFPLLPSLARAHRVVAVDLPGFGSSTPAPRSAPPRGMTEGLAFFVEPIAAFVAAHDLAGAAVLGHSLGGFVALELALRFDLAKLVLVASMGLGPEVSLAARAFFRVWPERLARLLGPKRFAMLSPFPDTPVGRRLGALAFELYARPGGRAPAARAFDALAPLLGPAPHVRDRLGGVKADTLVVWGERDEALPPSLATAAVAAIPRARAHLTPLAHSPHLEAPAAFLPVLLEFLAKT